MIRLCWHKWSNWVTFQKGLFSWQQFRGCDKCGKVKLREANV